MNSTERKPTGLPPTDEEGFLTKGDVWSEEVAELLAKILMPGDLTEDHWTVINYMRQYYLEFKSVPPVRKLSRDTGISLRHPFGRKDGFEYLGVPRTAAQVAPQGLLDLLFGGIRVVVIQGFSRHDHPGRAVAALYGKVVDKGLLKGIQAPVLSGQPLDGQYLLALGLHGQVETAFHGLAVNENRA